MGDLLRKIYNYYVPAVLVLLNSTASSFMTLLRLLCRESRHRKRTWPLSRLRSLPLEMATRWVYRARYFSTCSVLRTEAWSRPPTLFGARYQAESEMRVVLIVQPACRRSIVRRAGSSA
jgi:hypothetical protein